MFWKKKRATEEPSKPKATQLSPREILINQIERLGPGESLTYRLTKKEQLLEYAPLVVVELNPQYPRKGRKYIMSRDRIVEGRPAGKKVPFWDPNKTKDIASWILEREGVLFS